MSARLAAALIAGLSLSAVAQDVGIPVSFPGGASSAEAPPTGPRIVFDSGESVYVMRPWDTLLFHGVSPDPEVVFEVSRRGASGEWSPWKALKVKRFPNGRFWGKAILERSAGPLRLRARDGGATPGGVLEIFSVEVYDSTEVSERAEEVSPEVPVFAVGGGPRPLVHGREEWKAQPPKEAYLPQGPVRITLHHTAGVQTKTLAESLQEVRFIQDFHMHGRGWNDIGYHFLVDSQGNIFMGRPETAVGAHVKDHNTGNIGISLMATHHPPRNDAVTQTELDAVAALGRYLVARYGIDPATLRGHRDWNKGTECPGDLSYARLDELRAKFGEPPAAPPSPAVEPGRVKALFLRWFGRPSWDGARP